MKQTILNSMFKQFNDQSNADYGLRNQIIYSIEVFKSNLCD